MKNKKALDLLKNEFIFYSQWWPIQSSEARKVPFDTVAEEKMGNITRYHRDMLDAGVKIHTFDISTGWCGEEEIDTTDMDRVLEAFFTACPDGYLIPRINQFNASNEWLSAHPTEIFVFERAADATPDELKSMIGTEKQHAMGVDEGVECIGYQSFASELWKKDVEKILRKVIRHMEDSPYADRIIGYHMGYGRCGETHFWGHGIDHSQVNKQKFLEYGLQKYGTKEKLADLVEKAGDLKIFLNEGKQVHRDYFEYLSYLSYSLVRDFGKIIKEMTGKAVGFFHGYYLWGDPQVHGHVDLKWLLDDPNIDFMAAPKAYYRTGYGEPGGGHSIPTSINRKKLWIDENDSRTHRVYQLEDPTGDVIYMCGGGAENVAESKWVMWREFARNEMFGSAMWWMDLGGGWYDDPELLMEMEKLYAVKRQIRDKKKESIAEILVVIDENVFQYSRLDRIFNGRTYLDTVAEVASSGAPYDIYRLEDLKEIDLTRYKLVVFLNPMNISAEAFKTYKFAPGTRFLWNYIPGGSGESAEELVGMKLCETGKADVFPYYEIVSEEGIEILETYGEPSKDLGVGLFYSKENAKNGVSALLNLPEEGVRTATKGVHTVCTIPTPRKELIRKLGEEAGCRFYAPVGQYVYGDNRFIAVFYNGGYRFEVM